MGSLDWVLLPLSRYGGGGVSCVLIRLDSLVSGCGCKTDIFDGSGKLLRSQMLAGFCDKME